MAISIKDRQFFESICDEMRSDSGKVSVLDQLLEDGTREGDITISSGGSCWKPTDFSRVNEAFRLLLIENPDKVAEKYLRSCLTEYWLWLADTKGIIYASNAALRPKGDSQLPHHGMLLRAYSRHEDGHPKTYKEIGKYGGDFDWNLSGIYVPRQKTTGGFDTEASWVSMWASVGRKVKPQVKRMVDAIGFTPPLMLEINELPSNKEYHSSVEPF
jgi:hypothetical protein